MHRQNARRNELHDLKVLVVEDDFLIAREIATFLDKAGAVAIGPARTAEAARDLIACKRIDFAIIDINLRGEVTFDVPEKLSESGVPFVFATGYPVSSIPERFSHVPLLLKPYDLTSLSEVISGRTLGSLETKAPLGNKFLALLPPITLQRLKPHMFFIPASRYKVLAKPGDTFERVIFPTSGICSLLMGPGDSPVEVAVVGSEGFIGPVGLKRNYSYDFHVFVQVPGFAIGIDVEEWLAAIAEDRVLSELTSRYLNFMVAQLSRNTAAAASLGVTERLARWLLVCADRVGNEVNMAHEHIALMLNVRRAGVTESARALEEAHAIKTARGRITIIDRSKLVEIAGWTYRPLGPEYEDFLSETQTKLNRQAGWLE